MRVLAHITFPHPSLLPSPPAPPPSAPHLHRHHPSPRRAQFFAYEHCKHGITHLQQQWAALQPEPVPSASSSSSPPSSSSAQLRSLLAGGAAGVLGKLAVYPLDTVKRRLQVQGMRGSGGGSGGGGGGSWGAGPPRDYAGTLDALARIAREEGPLAGWYRGTLPAVLKSAVSVAVTFWAYERCQGGLRAQGWLLDVDGGGGDSSSSSGHVNVRSPIHGQNAWPQALRGSLPRSDSDRSRRPATRRLASPPPANRGRGAHTPRELTPAAPPERHATREATGRLAR